jgi:hypothetical protein
VTAETFELAVTLPPDVRFAATAAAVATHAAQFAGCAAAAAQSFGRDVEDAVRACIEGPQAAPSPIPLVVRRDGGPVEVIVGGRTLRFDV